MRYLPAAKGKGPSRHFTWDEVTKKGASGYPSMPLGPFKLPNGNRVLPRSSARKHAANMEKLRDQVNALRKQHHMVPTGINTLSWARSWQHNKDVGGAINSQHLYFDACDISVQEVTRLCPWGSGHADFDAICNRVFRSGGFGTYPSGSRHVDSRGYRARWSDFVGWKR